MENRAVEERMVAGVLRQFRCERGKRGVWCHISLIAVTATTVLLIDRPVALFIHLHFYSNPLWARHTTSIPDLLLMVVVAVEVVAWTAYFYRRHRHQLEASRYFLLDAACAVLASFLLKSLLKFLFGRINTRVWLTNPELYGFHWLNGGSGFEGFPSGHMAVFTTLFAAISRKHPRYKPLNTGILTVLAAALVATDYHFAGDVIAGAYLGVIVEDATYRMLIRKRHRVAA